ncbi:tRNA wybutosine-synthesizing protein 3 homolog [Babylonia areolata]|uniref:tRNA wybutosine-synthesizing protein 3 homolog n=1 Tax=Babylonia areolata TaxID=304850 RepID=UPI003FD0E38E
MAQAFDQLQTGCKQFQHQKEQCLSGADLSRKGSVDAPIADLVSFINTQSDCFTTSSCSGRVIVVDNTDEKGEVQKHGCHWLYVTHEKACCDSIKTSLQNMKGAAVFKFEPMVMHIQVRTLQFAKHLHTTAVASGFRNSGISIGGKGKIVVAVRSTHCLEVPLSYEGQVLVSDMYIDHLVQCANKKMQENIGRIARFFTNFKCMIENQEEKAAQGKHGQGKHHQMTSDELSDGHHHTQDLLPTNVTNSQNSKDSGDIEECFDCLLFEETS